MKLAIFWITFYAVAAWARLPLSTAAENNTYSAQEWMPTPTPKPDNNFNNLLLARQNSASVVHPTCGFWNGDGSSPLECEYANSYCGFDQLIHAAACCLGQPGASCSYYSRCIESSDLPACNSLCQADPYIAKCTNSNSPSCYTITYTDISYSNLQCLAAGGFREVARIPTTNVGDIDTNALIPLLYVTETPLPTNYQTSSSTSLSSDTLSSSTSSTPLPTNYQTSSSTSLASHTLSSSTSSTPSTTSTAPSSTSSSSANGLSVSDIFGIAIGVLSFLATFVAMIYTIKTYIRTRQEKRLRTGPPRFGA